MQNKEIERNIDKLVSKYGKNNTYSLDGSIRGFKIKQYIEQLELENKDYLEIIHNYEMIITNDPGGIVKKYREQGRRNE